MSRKDEFHTGTGKARIPDSGKDIFAEEERAPRTSRLGTEQDSAEIGAPGTGLPKATGTGTVQNLNEDGNGTTVIRGLPNAPVATGAVRTPGGPSVPGAKVQPAERLVEGPKPTPASKRKDNTTPRVAPVIEGGQMTGVQPVERAEVDKAERAAAIRAAANRRPRQSGGTTDLRLGELAEADPTIHTAFKTHIQNWKQRLRKGMEAPAGQTTAAVAVGRRLADKGESGVIDHPAFRNDVTYQRVADAISEHVGNILDHKNKDKNGNPTVRKINADDLADFASYHRHIFGNPQHVNDVSPEGEPVHYRVDPAAFSMFNLVGKHQRRDKTTRQVMPQIKGQDAFHWMVGAIRNHIDSDATRTRRGIRLDARRERREGVAAQAKADNRGPEAIMPTTSYGEGTRSVTVKKTEAKPNSIGKLKPGARVKHAVHGEGTIVAHAGQHVTVDFGETHPVDKTKSVHRRLPVSEQVTAL